MTHNRRLRGPYAPAAVSYRLRSVATRCRFTTLEQRARLSINRTLIVCSSETITAAAATTDKIRRQHHHGEQSHMRGLHITQLGSRRCVFVGRSSNFASGLQMSFYYRTLWCAARLVVATCSRLVGSSMTSMLSLVAISSRSPASRPTGLVE